MLRQLGLVLGAAIIAVAAWSVTASAQEGRTIVINHIDASAFPTVVVDLTVLDEFGAPLPGLTVADFQIFEDGRKVPTGSIVLEAGPRQPIGLVFAVDLSTEPEELERIKDALLTFVDRMGPGDSAVLLSFFDQVRLEQAPTQDRDALRAAIQRLSIQGNYTSLNRVVVESINRAELLDPRRRAIVIVTDSVENINSLPLDTVYARSDQVEIPMYLVAYSPKSQPAAGMEAFGARIRAQTYVVDTASAAQLRLKTLTSLFDEGGYRLRFISQLPADSGDHSISINLAQGGGLARVDATVQALPAPLSITLPGLTDGMRAGGVIDIAPQIAAPGPVRQVEYLIDGQSVARLDRAPFAYRWDSTAVMPGSHVVGVRATDSAGNRGEAYVTLQIVDPLVITARTTKERLYVGDQVSVLVDVESLRALASVELLLDGVVVDERQQPPYVFALDSTTYAQGTHIVTVRATDASGFAEATKFSLDLLPPPPRFIFSQQTWLRIFAFASIVLAILLAYLLLAYLAAAARRRRRQAFQLELQNLGNTVSSYLIRADDPKGALRFFLFHNGLALQGRRVTRWEPLSREELENRLYASRPVAPVASAPAARAVPMQTNGAAMEYAQPQAVAAQATAGAAQAQTTAKAGLERVKGAGQSVKKVGRFADFGANLLAAVAVVLPSSLGGRVAQRAASSTRGVYHQARAVERVQVEAGKSQRLTGQPEQAPLTALQQRDRDQSSGGQAPGWAGLGQAVEQGQGALGGVETPQPAAPVQPQAAAPASGPFSNGQPALGAPAPPSPAQPRPEQPRLRYDSQGVAYEEVTRTVRDAWTETPEIGPGDSLLLELVVEPKRPRHRRRRPFRIASKSVQGGDPTLITQEGVVEIAGLSWIESFLIPALVIVLTASVCVFMALYLMIDFGLIEPVSLSTLFSLVR